MLEQRQNQGPQLQQVEAVRVPAEAAQAGAESNFQALIASESALQGDVCQLARCVRELADKVARMGQECDRNVEDVLFQRDELQIRLD